jgi:hypothetical protein
LDDKKDDTADKQEASREASVHDNINRQDNNSTTSARSKAERIAENGGENLLDAGLRAAARGWKIFPCDAKKHPLVKWREEATTDEAQIRAWAAKWPGAWWGRALTKDEVILDLDMKHGKNGIREFERLQGCNPDQFEAPRIATPTGGRHVCTNATGRDFIGVVDRIAPGIDTRTIGNLVIIPSGDGSYRWLTSPNTPMPVTPDWAEVALRRNSNLEAMTEARAYQGISPYGKAMLASACYAIKMAPGGSQEPTLSGRAYQMGRFIGGGILEYGKTVEALVAAGVQMVDFDATWEWTEKEIRKKVERRVRRDAKARRR